MGHHFGDLIKVRHIITYSLSPFEQKAFPNYFTKGIPNLWRRFRGQVFRVGPPFLLMYLVYSWGTQEHARTKRKDPSLYENDQ
uniref:Cytochrome b-c1 complex subunit 8 n=1 Tax=Geotrypetes seraphini TaxID=260995 RepID=A0A6P8Q6D3_GEOSA|nr:cytochrome b-c1 complex subunit 8 [Geotrypetes seraphini]XP_033782746.1 cytochrome b-c1 complex subunit 8 [Geotrypetes seraphini]XP_033782747.1 cytochrome b-c1 complex subunit 8 [Geotrypetes seraphini]XP_033782748.1 cytochrome b-c1 complex subunit 8 [Geotrypetes seraphini]